MIRIVYTDLDGTLLGPGGSLFAAPGGGVSRRAAEAIASLHERGVTVMPVSGRTVEQARETARILGIRDFVAELGGLTCYDLGAEIVRNYGAFPGGGTPYEAMALSGGPAVLLETFRGSLEPHAPWAFLPRECSMIFRGHVDVAAAVALLEETGYRWLDLRDNGVLSGRFPDLDVDEAHAYHLLPKGVDKSAAVTADMTRRGMSKDECIAVGDSVADAALHDLVHTVYIVANGRAGVEGELDGTGGIRFTEGSHGDGFAEAIADALT